MEVSPKVRWSNGMSKIIVHAYSYPKACRVICIAFFFCYLRNFCFAYAYAPH
jgi:hypothetical protein